jgi:hypothetical protein
VFFEAEDQGIEYLSSDAAGMNPIDVLSRNLWTSIIFVRRRELNVLPFVRNSAESGFGYEDWYFMVHPSFLWVG